MYYKKGDAVRLVKLPKRKISRLNVGMVGVVITTRPLIDNCALVKFKGKGGLVCVESSELERR